MKILVINYEFPPVGGGGGKVCEDICSILARRGESIRVLTSWIHGLPHSEPHGGYHLRRIPVFRKRRDRCSVVEMFLYVICSIVPAVLTSLRWRPDCIHVHFAVPSGVVAWIVSTITGVPYVLTVHLGDVPGGVPEQTRRVFAVLKPFTIPIWNSALAITALSEYTHSLACKAYARNDIRVVTHGIDLSRCDFEGGEVHTPLHFLFAGRFSVQKNLPFLMDCLPRLKDCSWHLTMAGDGPLLPLIRRKIESSDLASRISLTGWIDQNGVNSLMRRADIFLMPSTSEGFPIAAIYALACDMAFLASNIGGIRGIVINEYNGLLFGHDNPAEFELAFRRLVRSPEILVTMKKNSHTHAFLFDINKKADEYLNLLRTAASHRMESN
jgi:glycosyltransferase involved in cell wall biosynthesis